jgi:hypothetical protein
MNKTEFPSAFPQASQLKIKSIHAHSEYTLIFLSDRERWPEHKKSTAKERYFKMQHLYIPSFYYFLPERLRVTFFPTHLFYQYPFVSQHYFITIIISDIQIRKSKPFFPQSHRSFCPISLERNKWITIFEKKRLVNFTLEGNPGLWAMAYTVRVLCVFVCFL